MRYLLDTNVVSALRPARHSEDAVRTWAERHVDDDLFLSAMTIGELRRGVDLAARRDPTAGAQLEGWLTTVLEDFGGRVLPVDPVVAERWGRLDADRPISTADGLIAATALTHDMTVATRDADLLARHDVPTVNPFEPT